MLYLYQHSDWPRFTWDTARIADRLAAVRYRQGQLVGRAATLGYTALLLHLEAITSDIVQSSRIEGEILDEGAVRSSIARRLGIETAAVAGQGASDVRVERFVTILEDALTHPNEPLTRERLFRWHRLLLEDRETILLGQWRDDRDGPMRVMSGRIGNEKVHFEAVAARDVPAEMERFLEWFNAPDSVPGDTLLRAGIAHLWFLTIHPFDDGNGRLARVLADMMLSRADGMTRRIYSISAQIMAERRRYYEALEAAQKGEPDITTWLLWWLDCFERSLERAEQALDTLSRDVAFWRRHPASGFNERQRHVLRVLLAENTPTITSKRWAKLTGCAQITAIRDINDLLDKKALTPGASGGRSTAYHLVLPDDAKDAA